MATSLAGYSPDSPGSFWAETSGIYSFFMNLINAHHCFTQLTHSTNYLRTLFQYISILVGILAHLFTRVTAVMGCILKDWYSHIGWATCWCTAAFGPEPCFPYIKVWHLLIQLFSSLDDNEQKHVASASDHYEGSQRRTSVVVPAGRVDTDKQEAAESLLSIHSSPPMFTGE